MKIKLSFFRLLLALVPLVEASAQENDYSVYSPKKQQEKQDADYIDRMRNPVDLYATKYGNQWGGGIGVPIACKVIRNYGDGKLPLNAISIAWCAEGLGTTFNYDPKLNITHPHPGLSDKPMVEYLSGQLYNLNTGIKLTTAHFNFIDLYAKLGLGINYQAYSKNVYLLEFKGVPAGVPEFEYKKYYYEEGNSRSFAAVFEVGGIVKLSRYVGIITSYRMLKTPPNHSKKIMPAYKLGVCFGF